MYKLELNELKKYELDIAIYIDDFCRKNGIAGSGETSRFYPMGR